MLPFLAFLLGAGAVTGAYALYMQRPEARASRELNRRLRDVTTGTAGAGEAGSTVVKRSAEGPLPTLDRMAAKTGVGSWLTRLIEQSAVNTTPSAIVVTSLVAAAVAGLVTGMFVRFPFAPPLAAVAAGTLPTAYLLHRRNARLRRFEEQFPEALDLLSRAIRAGHAFQTALGMIADEVSPPVGPEFKKTFDQQNFGLPLKEALNQLSERVPILDVRFFVTAVLIQRETGGNLSEVLDNLAHVVRERFKILRQVRVHTAHGRFTGYVLVALPAALAIALSFINPDHMNVLFRERIGQMMLGTVIVMQLIGFLWIRQVIKIEV
jgi:tight adherence protein B